MPGQGAEQRQHDGQHDAADRDDHRVAEPAEDVAEVVPDPLDVEAGGVAEEGEHREQHHPHGRDLQPERHPRRGELDPLPGVSHEVARHSWVVRSRPYHSSDNAVSVPSSCISATIASTAS